MPKDRLGFPLGIAICMADFVRVRPSRKTPSADALVRDAERRAIGMSDDPAPPDREPLRVVALSDGERLDSKLVIDAERRAAAARAAGMKF